MRAKLNSMEDSWPYIIKNLRSDNKWSVRDLAARLARSPRTIEGWEQGRTIPEAAKRALKSLHREVEK